MRSLHKIGTAKVHKISIISKFICLSHEIGLPESVDADKGEEHADKGRYDDADDLDSLEPGLAAPADGLEHAPESVGEMEPESSEPHEVDDKHPPVAEESCKEVIRVVHIQLRGYLEKLRHLHVSPELCEMECDHTQDDKSEDEHILGRPGIGRSLAGHLITLVTAAGAHVLESKPDAIEDMDDETEGEDRDHNADHRSAHEVAAELEEAVASGEELVVDGDCAELAGEAVNDGEEVDGGVQQKEKNKESTADALDEFLSDG